MQKRHFTKFNTLSPLKNPNKQGIQGNYLNTRKVMYEKSTANIMFMVKAESISFKIRNKARMSVFITSIQHNTGSSSQSN